jgi:Response regulator of the LytR/AlgR family
MYTNNGGKYPLLKNPDYVESVCDPQQFFRINRQMLLNRDAIISLEPYFNRKVVVEVKIKTQEKIIVSRLKSFFIQRMVRGLKLKSYYKIIKQAYLN